MNRLKVHILNPNKIMQRTIFVQASRLNDAKYSETNCDMSLYFSNIDQLVSFLLIWNKT